MIFGVSPVFCVLALMRDLKVLTNFSIVGILAVFVQCSSIVLFASKPLLRIFPCMSVPEPDCLVYSIWPTLAVDQWIGAAGKYLALFFTSFAIIATVPNVRGQLQDPMEMHDVLRKAFTIVCFLYCVVMTCGYLSVGSDVGDNIIETISMQVPWVGKLVSLALICNILMSAPLMLFCIVAAVEDSGDDAIRTPMTTPNIIMRFVTVIVMVIIAASLAYVIEIIGLIGSVFGVIVNIFMPATLHVMARRQVGVLPQNPILRQFKYISAVVIGILVMIFGFQGSLHALLTKMKADA